MARTYRLPATVAERMSSPVQFSQTLTFEDLGGDQRALTWHGRFPSAQERARVIKTCSADKGLSRDHGAACRLRRDDGNRKTRHKCQCDHDSARKAPRRSPALPDPAVRSRPCVSFQIGYALVSSAHRPAPIAQDAGCGGLPYRPKPSAEPPPFERLEIGRERRPVHGKKGRDAAELSAVQAG